MLFNFNTHSIHDTLHVSDTKREVILNLTNTGELVGNEVVQLYVSGTGGVLRAPIRTLKGFQRINLQPKEQREIRFVLSTKDLSYIDETGKMIPYSDSVEVNIGGGQPVNMLPDDKRFVKAILRMGATN